MDRGYRYLSLDHWRGFAALWVVWFHASALWARPAGLFSGWVHDFARLGWGGVHIFFVISGYCIAERVSRALQSGESPAGFLADRIARIYPAYWAALALTLVLAVAATPFNGVSIVGNAVPADPLLFLPDLALMAPLADVRNYLVVSWTLSCEVAFYAIAACALARPAVRRPALSVVLGWLLAVAQVAGVVDLPGFLLDLWPEFFCGLLAWIALQSRPRRFVALAGLAVITLLACGPQSSSTTLLPCAVLAALLVALKPYDARIASLRPLGWLGRVGTMSYSLYLIHIPFISPAQNLLHRLMPESAPHQALIPVALSVFALAPAFLFYRWVEQPVEAWRKNSRRRFHASA